MTGTRRLSHSVQITILAIVAVLYLVPFVLIVLNSFKSTASIIENPLTIPSGGLKVDNFVHAFKEMHYVATFFNSLIITALSVALINLLSSMTAHLLVRSQTRLSQMVFLVLVASMIIPFQAIMIPLVKIYGSLKMLDSRWTLVFMYIGFGAPLAVFIFHGFIKGIPYELEEAATIDGSSPLQTFFLIVFPLLRSTVVTVVILDVLWIWNDFLLPSLILIAPLKKTLPLTTYAFFGTYTVEYGRLMAALVLTVAPLIALYLFLQRQVIKGITEGSIK
jgi:raffinose/stachyose/melibiose transport system permease protein